MMSKNMNKSRLSLFLLLWFVHFVQCASRLTAKDSQTIDLHDTGTFVVGSFDDDYNEDESEMIQPKDIEHIESLTKDEEKYIPLHSYVAQFNRRVARSPHQPSKDSGKYRKYKNPTMRSLKWINKGKSKRGMKAKRSDDDDVEDVEDETTKLNRPSSTTKPLTTKKQKLKTENFEEFEITADEFDHSSPKSSITPDAYENYDEETTRKKTTRATTTYKSPATTTEKATTLKSTSTEALEETTVESLTTQIAEAPETEKTTTEMTTGKITGATTTQETTWTNSITPISKTEEMTANTVFTGEIFSSSPTSNYDYQENNQTTYASTESEKAEITSEIHTPASPEYNKMSQADESTTAAASKHVQEKPTISHEKATETVSKESTVISKHATKMSTTASLEQTTASRAGDKKPTTARKTTVKRTSAATTLEDTTEATELLEYEKIMPEYDVEIEDIQSENVMYNYTEDEIQKSLRKLMKKAVDIRKPRNCSQFDGFKYGFKAFGCALEDFQNSKNRTEKSNALGRTWKIVRIWLIIYACIAIPCWCQYGWCCCCCRCAICFPRRAIAKDQRYFADNPPGTLLDKDKPTTYEPTIFEEDAYEQLEKTIRHL